MTKEGKIKIIALESAGNVASVAIVEEDKLIGEYTLDFKMTHSQTLLPMLAELKERLELDLEEVDAIAVSEGPGSFTGLRIGEATAKGLGLAMKKPLIGVSTLDAMGYQLYGFRGMICPIMDARRGQVYGAIYRNEEEFLTLEGRMAVSIEEFTEKIKEHKQEGDRAVFLGDGTLVFREKILELLKEELPVVFAPPHVSRQKASALGMVACQRYKEGKAIRAADHRPVYLRKTQAEREREERLKKNHGN